MADLDCPFVSRAGLKLAAALDALRIDPAGLLCADLGCNVGGFTDCLMQRGAARVYAVDTAYGTLAWKLRKDGRVVVMERTNALDAEPPEPVDLVVVDVGWTPQKVIMPAAEQWLGPGGQVLSLLKPHYEATAELKTHHSGRPRCHVLAPAAARAQCLATCQGLADAGWNVRAVVPSPILGAGGNTEFVVWMVPRSGRESSSGGN